MSEIASKKKRNEFLISSAEKSKGYSTVFLSFYSIPIYSRQGVFFSLSLSLFFLIWLVQAKILRDVPKSSSSVQWNKSISCINTPNYQWNCIMHFCLEPTNSGPGEGFTMKHVIVYLDG